MRCSVQPGSNVLPNMQTHWERSIPDSEVDGKMLFPLVQVGRRLVCEG